MDLTWIKVGCLVAIFVIVFLSALAPLWISRKKSASGQSNVYQLIGVLSNCLGGGIFLSVCFLGLLPHVREKFDVVFEGEHGHHLPATEMCLVAGYFLILLVEQVGQHCRQRSQPQSPEPHSVDLGKCPKGDHLRGDSGEETPEEAESLLQGSPSCCTTGNPSTAATTTCTDISYHQADSSAQPVSLKAKGESSQHLLTGVSSNGYSDHGDCSAIHESHKRCSRKEDNHHGSSSHAHSSHGHSGHGHSHSVNAAGQPLLKSAILLIALGLHSVFEGVALGLQEDLALFVNLFVSVLLHEVLCAFAMGLSLCSGSGSSHSHDDALSPSRSVTTLSTGIIVKLCLVFSVTIPIGMVIGMAVTNALQGEVGALINGVLQGVATGTLVNILFCEILPMALAGPSWPVLKSFFLFLGAFVMGAVILVTDSHETHLEESHFNASLCNVSSPH